MSQTMRFQETLRKLAMIDERFVEDQAGLGPALAGTPALHPKTAALLQLGASVVTGASLVRAQWSTVRALAVGATDGGDRCRAAGDSSCGRARRVVLRRARSPPSRSAITSRPRWKTRAINHCTSQSCCARVAFPHHAEFAPTSRHSSPVPAEKPDLAEGERVGLNAGIEEGDLEGAVGDRAGLPDELVAAAVRSPCRCLGRQHRPRVPRPAAVRR